MSSSAAVHTRDSLLLQLQTLKNQFEQRHLTDLFAQMRQRTLCQCVTCQF